MPYIFRCENCLVEETIDAVDVGTREAWCRQCGLDGCNACIDSKGLCEDCAARKVNAEKAYSNAR